MAITIKLDDKTNFPAESTSAVWVPGWINGGDASTFQTLQANGSFGPPSATLPFYKVENLAEITLVSATNGSDRLVFVASDTTPGDLNITDHSPVEYAQYPYAGEPTSTVTPPGPFDIFEFSMDAEFNLSAVSGFGLNLSFSATPDGSSTAQNFGVQPNITRAEIASAWSSFIVNETKTYPPAAAFEGLLYKEPLPGQSWIPPLVGDQFFALCDPNDMLAARSNNYTGTTSDPLATFWDKTLDDFFCEGNFLSINLGSDTAQNIYQGMARAMVNPKTGVQSVAYHLSNGSNSYSFFKPVSAQGTSPGLTGAAYVFQQAFGDLTPDGSNGDAGLLQDCIWEALCRGVALDGVLEVCATDASLSGYTTRAWNNWKNWYPSGKPSHFYAKFLHCSDKDGNDSRITGKPPIFYGGAAYGFSMDETPIGPYSGPNVPSKTVGSISNGTVTITVGPWG
ncbi:conserved hypothetical protein [Roseibium sp. TrichSKD4]|uniref:hypothetical protein n=1 Tax=Roseibium sp. TrichSKD4 TaxID=744980 RepID=UPI0001E56A14|nr:hypothetical protein [Roseibium sp. TrichSKD4]EFO31098.1 conserved hypothetical protein [Roseibium sp. TrichSKD4]